MPIAQKSWTTREIAVLQDTYPSHGAAACTEKLPGRTVGAILKRASLIGLHLNRRQPRARAKTPIRDGADPAVRFLLRKLPCGGILMDVAADSGIGYDTFRTWRYRGTPRVDCLRRALNAMGYDLAVVDLETREAV